MCETFDEWWRRIGRSYDPDTEDVPWYDKRKALAEEAFRAGNLAVTDATSLAVAHAINELRREEGASVTINCTNPEGSGPDNEAVEVTSDWTNWQPHRFHGKSLLLALEDAREEKRIARRASNGCD